MEILIKSHAIETPAFVYDETSITGKCRFLSEICVSRDIKVLFALKCFSISDALQLIGSEIDGFSASSVFEATLSRSVVREHGTIHITSPCIKPHEAESINSLCDYISFNSLSQWNQIKSKISHRSKCGIRINPELSLIKDKRYDPCRIDSKLGVPLSDFVETLESAPEILRGLTGLLLHTNCDSRDFLGLLETVRKLDYLIPTFLKHLDWINLGGGYLFDDYQNFDKFFEAIDILKSKYSLEIFIEPGASIVRDAGYLVASVVDIFEKGIKTVVVLDTSVNHMPEVFEYQFEPDVFGDIENGENEYLLTGSTCLAGDIFGEYSFEEPLDIGSRILFPAMGAYSFVKAHMFNGVNLPTIYALQANGQLICKKQFTYEDFANKWGAYSNVSV